MKNKIYFLIILILFIVPVRLVKAYELTLTGTDTIDKNITIKLELTDLKEYDGFYGMTATLSYDDQKLELTNITGENNFELTYGAAHKKIVLYSPTGTKDKNAIMSFQFKNIALAKDEETTISVEDIVATDSKKDITVENINKKIIASSNGNNEKSDNYLTSIKINGKSLELKEDELNYDILVSNDTDEIKIKAKSKNRKNTITGNGKHELTEGSNEIKIDVTDKDGETRTYTINVNREDSEFDQKSDELFLKSGERYGWNNLYFIPIAIILMITIILIIKKGKGRR